MKKMLDLAYDAICNQKTQQGISYVLLAVIFLLMLHLNYYFPLFVDDWSYSFVYGEAGRKVATIGDILSSQYRHYFLWGGRSVVHCIAQLLILIGKGWNDVLNSLAFVGLVYYMYLLSKLKKGDHAALLFLLAVFVWFCQPAFAATLIWITGSANYLWGTLIILIFCVRYFFVFTKTKDYNDSTAAIIMMFWGGVFAGWTNENMAIALLFFLGAILLHLKYRKENISKWMIAGFVGAVIGSVMLIAAPGNFIRVSKHNETRDISITFAEELMSRAERMCEHYLQSPLILSIIFICLLLYLNKTLTTKYKQKTLGAILFFAAAHVAFAVMIVSPQFPPRAMFGIIVFQIIAIGILYAQIKFSKTVLRLLNITVVIVMLGLFSLDYYWKKNIIEDIARKWAVRDVFIEEQIKLGTRDITFPNIMVYPPKYYMLDVSTDATNWANKACAIYYEVDSVRVISKTDFDAKNTSVVK